MNNTITTDQKELIDKLISVGYGYARYAKSVLASGRCSVKQHETLQSMVSRIEYKTNNKWRGEGDIDWDDKGDFYK